MNQLQKEPAFDYSTMGMHVVSTAGARNLSEEVMANGSMRVLPASFYADTTPAERGLLGMRHGIYGFLTLELTDWLQARIAGRKAIEIGAGHGALAAALAIPATDNMMQDDPRVKAHYEAIGQPTVPYGDNVQRLDAKDALVYHKPQVVIASWVTHLYKKSRHAAGGNMFGVNEEHLISRCEEYIFIGNEQVHKGKSIWELPHEIIYPDWLYSRAVNGSRNFIAVWKGSNK
ncbi:MAG: hypothetical protein V4621_07775 [Pseudomonadota bacterium]